MSDAVQFVEALAWPSVAFVLIFALSRDKGREFLAQLFGRVSRVKAAGMEIELTAQTSREVKTDLQATFRAFRDSATSVFDEQVHVERINVKLETVVREAIRPALTDGRHPLRATVYVPDILFEDVLYRLVDYYPEGGGRGTTYSARFGIIGKSWRLAQSEIASVPPEPERLIEEWGMTHAEATGQHRAKTLVCVILRDDEKQPVGLLFMESQSEDAFVEDVVERLEGDTSFATLAKAVERVTHRVREAGQPPLKIFDR